MRIKTRSFPARDSVFGDSCDDNICAGAVSALIQLPVGNGFSDPDFLHDSDIFPVKQRLMAT